jgi:hypothetical protein
MYEYTVYTGTIVHGTLYGSVRLRTAGCTAPYEYSRSSSTAVRLRTSTAVARVRLSLTAAAPPLQLHLKYIPPTTTRSRAMMIGNFHMQYLCGVALLCSSVSQVAAGQCRAEDCSSSMGSYVSCVSQISV